MLSPNAIYLNNTMHTPSQLIAETRPFICISGKALNENIDYLQEEIEAKGGTESLGKITREKYEIEVNALLQEIALRN